MDGWMEIGRSETARQQENSSRKRENRRWREGQMDSTMAQETEERMEGRTDSTTAQEMEDGRKEKGWMEGWTDKQNSSGDSSPHATVPSPCPDF